MRISNPGKQADRITDLSFAILQGNTHVCSSGPGLSHTALLYPSMLRGSHKPKPNLPRITVFASQFPATALFPLPPHSVLQPVIKGGRKQERKRQTRERQDSASGNLHQVQINTQTQTFTLGRRRDRGGSLVARRLLGNIPMLVT